MPSIRKLVRENRGFLIFMLAFGLIRTAVADYNPIPSGSMHPNILEGDVVLVNRLAFQLKVPLTDVVVARLGEPQRGDNRDNSADSRYIGLIPRDLLIGRASRILVSANITGNWMPRFDRFGKSLYN